MVMLIFLIIKFVVILSSVYLFWYGIRLLRVRHASKVIQHRLTTQGAEGRIEELVRLAQILRKDAPLVGRVCQLCATRGARGRDVEELIACFCRNNVPTSDTADVFRYFLYMLRGESAASSG